MLGGLSDAHSGVLHTNSFCFQVDLCVCVCSRTADGFGNKPDRGQIRVDMILLIAIVIIYIGQILEGHYQRKVRLSRCNFQRDLYYKRLAQLSLDMEKEQLEILNKTQDLQREIREVSGDSDEWSNDDDDENLANRRESWSSSSVKALELNEQLEALMDEAKQSSSLCNDIDELERSLNLSTDAKTSGGGSCREDLVKSLNELSKKVKELELENEHLKQELGDQSKLKLVTSKTKLEPDLIEYLEQHRDQLSLSFLRKAHETLVELRASRSDAEFEEYINALHDGHKNRVVQLAELQVSHKEAEIKLQLMKRRYDEELSSFNEVKIEHLLKNSGVKEFLDSIKEKNRTKEDIIKDLRTKIDMRQRDLEIWQSKYKTVEEQCNKYREEWRKSQITRDQIESELRAKQEHERRILNYSINMSSASSMIDNQVPPPPDIDVPSVADILLAAKSMGA